MRVMEQDLSEDAISLPRRLVRFPVELRPPAGFHVEDPATWPRIEGRLEYVGGRLLYMPPCGDDQMDTAASLVTAIGEWIRLHRDFVQGSNEAGMLLRGDARGAEAAIWRRSDLPERTGGSRTVAPILAAEVAGQDEGEPELRQKAQWYFEHGVAIVWLVLPQTREVVVLRTGSDSRHHPGETLLAAPELPGLTPVVARFFEQLD